MSSEQNHELALESDPFYRNWRELIMPERVEVDKGALKATVKTEPERQEITMPIQEQLIVELYSK